MSKCTNLDIEDAACLQVVHILQHPTSCPTTKSTQNTMVNVPQKNILALLVGDYGKSTKRSTNQPHQANQDKSSLETETVRAVGALRSVRSPRCLGWRNDEKCTCYEMQSKRNGSRIMLQGRPLRQERNLKPHRQQFSKSRKI